MPRLLIVDDEPSVLYSFEKGLSHAGLSVSTAQTGAQALREVERDCPDVVILDIRLPDMSGLEVFDHLRELDSRLPVIVVTAHSTADTAIDAMKRGAFEYLLKPIDIHQLRELVGKAIELSRLQHVPALFDDSSEESGEEASADRIVGRSPAMQEVYKTIGRVALEDVTVLILGESGTGKELIARAIYHHSGRSQKPFLAINCAALPETLLESELFGHERGAFTGADQRRIGKFEQAHEGTLFLDEVGDMSPTTQAKVLRVLQDGRFERVGGGETVATNVRVVAATNQDLDDKIEAGEFRRDLLYRLNGFTIRLPPLRERLDDLPRLIEYFLKRANNEVSQPARRIAPEAMQFLETYGWPGNVRELQSVIKYAVVHAAGKTITPECLPENCRGLSTLDVPADALAEELSDLTRFIRRLLQADEPELYRRLQTHVDRIVLGEALKHTAGNQVHASQRLGMSRTTLRAKLSSLGMEHQNFDSARSDRL